MSRGYLTSRLTRTLSSCVSILSLSSVACGCVPAFRFRQRPLWWFLLVGRPQSIEASVMETGCSRGVIRGKCGSLDPDTTGVSSG